MATYVRKLVTGEASETYTILEPTCQYVEIGLLLLDESYKIVLRISIEAYMRRQPSWFDSSNLAELVCLVSTLSFETFPILLLARSQL